MSYQKKRPFSPNTIETDNEGGFGISKLLSFFKPKSSQQQYKQQKQRPNQIPSTGEHNLVNIETDPLVNNFSSTKKRALSIQSLQNSGVPRSSTLNSKLGTYTNYYDTLKNESEVLDNDLERRLSAEYGKDIVKQSVLPTSKPQSQERDDTSMSDLMKPRPSILPDTKNVGGQDDMPIIIEHEFAPLYKDSDGNLVRPPFLNLNPRERYHVLQLKKSIQASESLQNRIKYMINPNETHSKPLKNTNSVETSTQTHGQDYLENSLNFSNLKKRLLMKKERNKNKRASNSRGYFIGEFEYDDIENNNEKSKDKLHGYLGDISKPQFNKNTDTKKNGTSITIQPRKDENQIFNRFSNQNIKSTDNRFGLDDSLLKNENVNVSLDSDYVAKSEKITNIIKLKTDNTNKTKEQESVQPSSGFKFSINSNDINSIINKKQEDDRLISKSSELLTNDDSKISDVKPSFSFCTSAEKKDNTNELLASTEKKDNNNELLASTEKKDNNNKPAFSFGSNKPEFTFGARTYEDESSEPISKRGKTTEKKEEAKPTFSFGKPTENKNDLTKPTFSLGASVEKQNDTGKPKFTFGKPVEHKDSDRPALSFGSSIEKKDDSNKPSFSFGAASEKIDNTDKPKLSFGVTSDKKDDIPKPSLPFGTSAEKKDETVKPSITFGASGDKEDDAIKPAFAFGASAEKKDEAVEPSFTFGADGEKKDDKVKPAFGFGASTEKKDETAKPSFTFGASAEKKDDAAKPSFTFSAGTEKKQDIHKPAFTFAASNEKKETTPSFSFGEKPSSAAFGGSSKFGAVGQNNDSTQKPFEKPPVKIGSGTATPNFSFGGSKETTPKPNFSFASGTGASNMAPNNNATAANNLFNFTGTVSKEGTPDPASIFGGATSNMKPNDLNNSMNGLNKSAESSPFGFNTQKNTADFKFANGIQPQFNSGLSNTDMNSQNFSQSSVMTPPTLSTTPPIIKSSRKIAQMRLRRR